MKRRMTTLVLFLCAFTSRMSFGDGGWTPGNPKPGIEFPDKLFAEFVGFLSDFWTYLTY